MAERWYECESTFYLKPGEPLPNPRCSLMGRSPLTGNKYLYKVKTIKKLEWSKDKDGQPVLLATFTGRRREIEEGSAEHGDRNPVPETF